MTISRRISIADQRVISGVPKIVRVNVYDLRPFSAILKVVEMLRIGCPRLVKYPIRDVHKFALC